MDEVARVLQSAEFRLHVEDIVAFLSYGQRSIDIYPDIGLEKTRRYFASLRDKKDAHVLAAFSELRCDVLVAGDVELLRKIPKAMTSRQVIEILLSEETSCHLPVILRNESA